jgi:DNA-binding XRE family transcriptional regulator
MGACIHAKVVKGKKIWYVWGGIDDYEWKREYPHCQSRSEFYDVLRKELGLSRTASKWDVVRTLFDKTWTGTQWVDDFTLRLRTLREAAGLTQAQLAEKAGLSVQAIAALEQGTRGPTWDTVRRLAYALKVGVEKFKSPFLKLPPGAEIQATDDEND